MFHVKLDVASADGGEVLLRTVCIYPLPECPHVIEHISRLDFGDEAVVRIDDDSALGICEIQYPGVEPVCIDARRSDLRRSKSVACIA